MKITEPLTKVEIAHLLNPIEPLSIRSVERYIQRAGVKPLVKGKGRGGLSKYRREDVDVIVAAYHRTREEREAQPSGSRVSTALTCTTWVTNDFECCDADLLRQVSEHLSANMDKPVRVEIQVLKSLKRQDAW
jgi:hypothetical protein